MGGSAFPQRYTPRMPPVVYTQTRGYCHDILRRYFTHVATPIEAPAKKDYGDVDILVACPIKAPGKKNFCNVVACPIEAPAKKDSGDVVARPIKAPAKKDSGDVVTCLTDPTKPCDGQNTMEVISKALGAVEKKVSSIVSANFALPRPPGEVIPDNEADNKDAFIQVDLHVCQDKQNFDLEMFRQAHGDLGSILGSTIRKYGLKINNDGFFLRIEEIELIEQKKSLISLTKSPDEILEFLGLDSNRWWTQFKSVKEMFEYAASCRLFSVKDEASDETKDEAKDETESEAKGESKGEAKGTKMLKHSDRKRLAKRHVYREWIEEFIPQCRSNGQFNRKVPSREEVKDEAFKRFNVEKEYNERLYTWKRKREEDEMWRNIIKNKIPTKGVQPHVRGAAIYGLKAIIIERKNISDGIIPPKRLAGDFYDVKAVIDFVERNWETVADAYLKIQKIPKDAKIPKDGPSAGQVAS